MGNKRNRNRRPDSSSNSRQEMSLEEATDIFQMFSVFGTLREYPPYGGLCIVKDPLRLSRKDFYDALGVLAKRTNGLDDLLHFWIPSNEQLRYIFPNGLDKEPIDYIQLVIKYAVNKCKSERRFVLTSAEFAELVRPFDEEAAQYRELAFYLLNGDDASTIGQGPIVKIFEKFIRKSSLSPEDSAALIAHIEVCPNCFMRNLITAINACAAHMDRKPPEVSPTHDSHGQLAIEELEQMMLDPFDEK